MRLNAWNSRVRPEEVADSASESRRSAAILCALSPGADSHGYEAEACSETKRPAFAANAASARHPSPEETLAWFTEPKLAEGERRMVDQTSAGWNRLTLWLRLLNAIDRGVS